MSEIFKLSPSDFGFLYDECKKCFYLKVKHNFDRPRTPMPSIFTKIDGIMKNYFEGKSPKDIADNLPEGKVEFGDKWIQSKPLADKKTMHKKDEIMPNYAELIYNGFWHSKARYKLQKIIDKNKNKVNGKIKLKLYKGNITIISRQTKSNAYSLKKVSFEENKTFNKKNVENFIKKNFKKL